MSEKHPQADRAAQPDRDTARQRLADDLGLLLALQWLERADDSRDPQPKRPLPAQNPRHLPDRA